MGPLRLSDVRRLAFEAGLSEVYLNRRSRIVSFMPDDDEADERGKASTGEDFRLNVHYATATVCVCLNERQERVFWRDVDLGTLANLMADPRMEWPAARNRRERVPRADDESDLRAPPSDEEFDLQATPAEEQPDLRATPSDEESDLQAKHTALMSKIRDLLHESIRVTLQLKALEEGRPEAHELACRRSLDDNDIEQHLSDDKGAAPARRRSLENGVMRARRSSPGNSAALERRLLEDTGARRGRRRSDEKGAVRERCRSNDVDSARDHRQDDGAVRRRSDNADSTGERRRREGNGTVRRRSDSTDSTRDQCRREGNGTARRRSDNTDSGCERRRPEGNGASRRSDLIDSARERRGNYFRCRTFHFKTVRRMLDPGALFLAMGPKATVVGYDTGDYASTPGLPEALRKILEDYPQPALVALGSSSRFYVHFRDRDEYFHSCKDPAFARALRGSLPFCVAFGAWWNSWVVGAPNGWSFGHGIPADLAKLLRKRSGGIYSVSLGPRDEWFLSWEDGDWRGAWTNSDLDRWVKEIHQGGWHVRDLYFGGKNTNILRYGVNGSDFRQYDVH